jgi:hypothetical protein
MKRILRGQELSLVKNIRLSDLLVDLLGSRLVIIFDEAAVANILEILFFIQGSSKICYPRLEAHVIAEAAAHSLSRWIKLGKQRDLRVGLFMIFQGGWWAWGLLLCVWGLLFARRNVVLVVTHDPIVEIAQICLL